MNKKDAVKIIHSILEENKIDNYIIKVKLIENKNKGSIFTLKSTKNTLVINKNLLDNYVFFLSKIGHEIAHILNNDKTPYYYNMDSNYFQLDCMQKIRQEIRADIMGYQLIKNHISKEEYISFLEYQKKNCNISEEFCYKVGYPSFDMRISLVKSFDIYDEDIETYIDDYYLDKVAAWS